LTSPRGPHYAAGFESSNIAIDDGILEYFLSVEPFHKEEIEKLLAQSHAVTTISTRYREVGIYGQLHTRSTRKEEEGIFKMLIKELFLDW
jgi:hypothetical protein